MAFRGYRHAKEKTENLFNITSVPTGKQLKHLGLTALGNNCLWKKKDCSVVIGLELMLVFDLREMFPASMSRASHVRSAKEAEGRRLTTANTCKQRKKEG